MKLKEQSDKKANLDVLGEVLKTFFLIDKKILDLHKCSSDDFLSLNRIMKQNHQKATYVKENVALAFEKIGPEGNLKNFEHLKQGLKALQEEFFSFENEINSKLSTLERIQANFSLMFVPINNFRQNLASLKLLLSNIKLTNNLYDRSLKNFSENEAIRIESVINKVKESCPVFEENIYVIQKHLKTLYQDLLTIKDLIIGELEEKLETLRADFEVIEKHHEQTASLRNTADKITQNFNRSVGSIITNLQYHDIIRQKMDHIQQTHKLIIKEINQNSQQKDNNQKYPANPFFLQIPQIIEIQTAQLLHANKDYQGAIDHISKKMIEIGQDINAIARLFRSLIHFEFKGKTVSRVHIDELFQKLVSDKKECIGKFKAMTEDVNLIQRIINNLFEKFNDLEMIENSIEQSIVDKISFGNLLVSEESETASQAQQILKLYADNHFEKNKIRTLFDNSASLLKELVKSNNEYLHEQKGMEKINQNLGLVSDTFNSINENLEFIEDMQLEIMEKSIQIEEAGKEVVVNVKYYDFFEKTIDQLIEKFDHINTLLKDKQPVYHDSSEQKRGLEQIEKYYTMKSERIIHNSKLANPGSVDELKKYLDDMETTDNERDGNDVEFF